ncbi:aspartate aminotransferase family protein [Chroococcus sp. FPU101]|uniref:aspartate aminotransferase family protein n=1 Tax=Chroococcus sp. FPU101 TaxID=1974212 RepID=UPI001A908F13|nr:aspartate aminotransferase family protein [Chroococcus sp. FPU101]GFE67433.1 aminotransferase class-III, putative glutamate-1-semialdehyde aminotransferase [Chroococcus sp. FPU101]
MQLKQDKSDIQRKHLAVLIESYIQRTPRSKQLAQQNRAILADKSSIGFSFSPELKEICYPIAAEHSKGSRLWDIDGNEYIDILMGLGINLFGHNPPFIQKAIIEQLEKGIHIGTQTELAGEVAQLVSELTGMERVTFSNTGTEAIMTAIRIARAATNRNKIVIFTNSYHGHSDQTLMRATLTEYAKKAVNRIIERKNWLKNLTRPLQTTFNSNLNPRAVPAAMGIPANLAQDVLVLDYGNEQSLEVIKAYQNEIAAVLVEPVQSRCPELQPKEFLQKLRQITQESGIVLIFDEMVTGFRIQAGGAQAWFDIKADLVTYSKIVGGGLPMSIIAGKNKYIDRIDGGLWNFGDQSVPSVKTTFFAGTFCKHPLSLATAKAVLQEIKEQGTNLYDQLNQRTAQLVKQLNNCMEQDSIPIRFTHFGSFFAIAASQSTVSGMALTLLSYHLLNRGIHLRIGDKGGFLSTAHSAQDIEYIIQSFRDSAKELQTAGLIST